MSDLLDINEGLNFTDNDKDLYKELLQLFIDENNFDNNEFLSLIEQSKEKASTYIHRIKGAASQTGAVLLTQKAQQLEDVLRNKLNLSLPLLINEFCDLYNKTLKEIKKVISTL